MSFVGKSPAQFVKFDNVKVDKSPDEFVNVDNVNVDKDERPTGTSAQAGLRRITRKAPQ